MKNLTAYDTLTLVISQMVVDTVDENTTNSLRLMLELEAFKPLQSIIEDKIVEIGLYLKGREARPVSILDDAVLEEDDCDLNEELRVELESALSSPPFEYEDCRNYAKDILSSSLKFDKKITIDLVKPKDLH